MLLQNWHQGHSKREEQGPLREEQSSIRERQRVSFRELVDVYKFLRGGKIGETNRHPKPMKLGN